MFTPFGYYGPCKKLFLSVWTLSSAGIVLFVSIQIVGHFDYGQRNLEFGLFLVGVLILGLMLAALATFLNLILMGFPEVSFQAKCSGWLSVFLVWGILLFLHFLR